MLKNKYFILFILLFLVMTDICFAGIAGSRFKIAETPQDCEVFFMLTPDMEEIENKENDDVTVTKSFKITKNGLEGELRYSLFADTGTTKEDLNLQFAMWVFMCLNNIAGYEVPGNTISSFDDNDVKKEFNGDFGCTTFLQNPKSGYAEGYKYIMAEFFYKEGQGIVMRAYLFNDINFAGITKDGIAEDSPLFSNYHTFKFVGENKAANQELSEEDRSRLLALIDEFRNDKDCAKDFIPSKYSEILNFALESPVVHIVIDESCYPKEIADCNYSGILLLAFIAGNVEHQLKTNTSENASEKGLDFQLLKYKHIKKHDKKLKIKVLEQRLKAKTR